MAAQRFDDPQKGFIAADGAATLPRDTNPSRSFRGRVLAWLRACLRVRPARRPDLRELARLGDHLLRDIGIDPGAVPREPMPPTWDQWRG